jgi:hypothetical protein
VGIIRANFSHRDGIAGRKAACRVALSQQAQSALASPMALRGNSVPRRCVTLDEPVQPAASFIPQLPESCNNVSQGVRLPAGWRASQRVRCSCSHRDKGLFSMRASAKDRGLSSHGANTLRLLVLSAGLQSAHHRGAGQCPKVAREDRPGRGTRTWGRARNAECMPSVHGT